MHKYKLQYFNFRGKGEAIRYIFALAGQDYVDERIDREKEWSKVKPTTLWGTLPQLTIDDEQPICQMATICKVLGSHFELIGNSEKDKIYIDMLNGCTDDITQPLIPMYYETDESKKHQLMKAFEEKSVDMLKRLEGFLQTNNNGDGWFIGNSITIADVLVYTKLSWILDFFPDLFSNYYQVLAAFMKRFETHDKIAEWIIKRPKTPY